TFIASISKWCWNGVTLTWVETNGQATVLVLRDGVPIGLTIDASAQGINEIMWFLRPSKLAAISKSGQKMSAADAPGPAAASAPPRSYWPCTHTQNEGTRILPVV